MTAVSDLTRMFPTPPSLETNKHSPDMAVEGMEMMQTSVVVEGSNLHPVIKPEHGLHPVVPASIKSQPIAHDMEDVKIHVSTLYLCFLFDKKR